MKNNNERFKVHKMIESQTTAEDVDVDFLKKLIAEGRLVDDLKMHIEDTVDNKILTYRECVDLLNQQDRNNEDIVNVLEDIYISYFNSNNPFSFTEKVIIKHVFDYIKCFFQPTDKLFKED